MKALIPTLKQLPSIAFTLMLGTGMVITAMACWLIWIIGYGVWPESAAGARVDGLARALLASLALIGVVIIALAFGKIRKASASGSVVSGEIEFDD